MDGGVYCAAEQSERHGFPVIFFTGMRIEFADLIRANFSADVATPFLLMIGVVLIMQTALTCWMMHLTPHEIQSLRLP